jgi:methyl-accepting chemotaxis protein
VRRPAGASSACVNWVKKEVKRSTHVQRSESRHIAQSVEVVASRTNQILTATIEQKKQSEQLLEALKVFREVTVENALRAEEMQSTVDVLSERAGALDEKVGRFSLEPSPHTRH